MSRIGDLDREPARKPLGKSPSDAMRDGRYAIAALEKGLRVLSIFSEQRRALRVNEIAALARIPQPTVFRILKTLELSDYIEQLPDQTYRPGPRVLTLGYSALLGLDVVEASVMPLRQLASKLNETVNLGLLVGQKVMYAVRLRNRDLVTANLQVGSLLTPYCSSLGKVLMAFAKPEVRKDLVRMADWTDCHGPRALRSREALEAELVKVTNQGWALQDEEVAHGIRSIAAPVLTGGVAQAGINVAVQSSRWPVRNIVTTLLPPLLETASDVSRRLGSQGLEHTHS